VLVERARGRSNGEIAQRMFISEPTVKMHAGRILAKLSLRDPAQVVAFAYENGVVHPRHGLARTQSGHPRRAPTDSETA
jgi:hypothetical protein